MHAVIVRLSIEDAEAAGAALREQVVPYAQSIPGFAGGYWTVSEAGDGVLAVVVFDAAETAQTVAEQARTHGAPVPNSQLEGVEVREVVAHA